MTTDNAHYQRGYAAGRKRAARDAYRARVRNDRLTALAAAIISAAMQGNWGKVVDGKHVKYTLDEMASMSARAAEQLERQLTIF